jgi:hypothetical protein
MQPAHFVIDTQTILDWWFFRDAGCSAWAPPSGAPGSPSWCATAAMRDELADVLLRPWPERWATPPAEVLALFDRHTTPCLAPMLGASTLLRCSDRDDQKFIDLALALAPACLVSRDRALLKLARRAALRGVQILPPKRWKGFGAPADAALQPC